MKTISIITKNIFRNCLLSLIFIAILNCLAIAENESEINPFNHEVQQKILVMQNEKLNSDQNLDRNQDQNLLNHLKDFHTPPREFAQNKIDAERAKAAEALGYMRAYNAENALVNSLNDKSTEVRRNAALALAWCGNRKTLKPLLQKLNDTDWTVRQAAAIALENLTGTNIHFNALDNIESRKKSIENWTHRLDSLPTNDIPDEIKSLITSPNHIKATRAIRAAGALGVDSQTIKLIVQSIESWRKKTNEQNADAKIRVQSALRALGRSQSEEAFPILRDFLQNPQWTRYAADALGDFGGNNAAAALIEIFPPHARIINDKILSRESVIRAKATHPSDAPHLDARDRILSAPYAILFSLSRINFDDPQLQKSLKQIVPLIAQQIPLDIDRLVFYEEEPFQKIFRSLIIRAGEKDNLLEFAFNSLEFSANPESRSNVSSDKAESKSVLSPLSSNSFNLPTNTSFNSNLILTLCREPSALSRIIPLLNHPNHWVRINAAKTLTFIGDRRAIPALRDCLEKSKREGDYGEFAPPPYKLSAQGQDEFNDPTPRYREALVMSLGFFRDTDSVPLLIRLLNDDKNSLGIQHRAALSLDKIGTDDAVEALREAELNHPTHSVRLAAREAIWRHNISPLPRLPTPKVVMPVVKNAEIPQRATKFVFIKGDIIPPNNPFQMDSWRQAYATTDSGPTYRPGRNLYVLTLNDAGENPIVQPITNFKDGYIADCEVSYDSKTIWFSRREQNSPWWHIFRVRADGSELKQITDGKFHDVQPVELPSGRIAFSSTRLGMRDEYHGYLATGLSTMTPDGRDIQVIGFNLGRDSEPSVSVDGNILITRLELFYSRMKTEYNLISLRPDGTQAQTLYGPERRSFWRNIHGGYGNWFAGGLEGGRHRVLRLTQPQAFSAGEVLLTTPAGPVLTRGKGGEKLLRESFLRSGGNDEIVITTAIRLDENRLLVAAGKKNKAMVKDEFPKDGVVLGIYTMDISTGELTLLYEDRDSSCYEARVLHPRLIPPVVVESELSRGSGFTGTIYAQSVFHSRESRTRELGKLLRVVEGLPQVTRHASHTIPGEFAWKNHGGSFGRDLGVIPLLSDGSFAVEVPADRLISLQVLDGDRNVVGNQLIWMSVRPGESKGCIGCHEGVESVVSVKQTQATGASRPVLLPLGGTFNFHAKVWFKGSLPDEREERQRTVQSANWFARP
ncbi:MAG: HEAT repeat domain-containing protein [Planctomycetaceae bacterium]|jgi:HEAT repeat protein|nr:HEAT repeat domain-containing protein [Planctomycetaceae bacterium]